MAEKIKFPTQDTYWIAYTNTDIFGYGVCTPEQEMTTGQPYLYKTAYESKWLKKLKNDFNVIPDETN